MDFGELDDVLDQDSYVPSFARDTKPKETKTLNKNSSNKSIQSNALGLGTQPQNPSVSSQRPSMLQLHKQTRKQVTTFQDFFKDQSEKSPTKPQPRIQLTAGGRPPFPASSKNLAKDELDINNILDQVDSPVVSRRNMKPPLSRKTEDGRSMASRRNDDNPSIGSRTQNRWMPKEEDKPAGSNRMLPTVSFGEEQSRGAIKARDTGLSNTGKVDMGDFKKMLQEQLQAQRQFSERILSEQKNLHKSELERIKKQHDEQMTRKLQLKDMQIKNLKENYELKLKNIYQNTTDAQQLHNASTQLQEGIRALQKAETQFKNRSAQLTEKNNSTSTLTRSFEDLSSEKERTIRQMLKKVEDRQAEFRQEKIRVLGQLERDRRKNEQYERRLIKKEQELEERYAKKDRMMAEEWERKNQRVVEEQSALRVAKSSFQQQRLKFQQEKADSMLRNKQWQQSKIKFMEELQIEKTKLLTKQIELNGLQHQFEARTGDLQFKEKQVEGRAKLMDLERKKWDTDRDIKRKTFGGGDSMFRTGTMGSRLQEELGASVFEKSLKQLKEEYLRNLGHI